ncbi:hypothetical protein BKA65DRAFT_49797 [Rhexocercosporidium sp. MPI-PUGE-AT-0058]|nr:hypothetical protein BKA65DRAFT_49797 [Rhexocercosporidium sp. MPI-PUGE-AT-0058]
MSLSLEWHNLGRRLFWSSHQVVDIHLWESRTYHSITTSIFSALRLPSSFPFSFPQPEHSLVFPLRPRRIIALPSYMHITMEYVNMLLEPIIGLAKYRSLSWPTTQAVAIEKPKPINQTLSYPDSPVRIESEESWADEVGGTVTETRKDNAYDITWRRREAAKKSVDKKQSSSHQNSGWSRNGSLYGQLKTDYHPYTTPAALSSRDSVNSTVTFSSRADAGSKDCHTIANEIEDKDYHDCGIFGHSDCAATHRSFEAPVQVKKAFKLPPSTGYVEKEVDAAVITPLPVSEYNMVDLTQDCARERIIDTKQVVSSTPRKTTRFGEELLGELYVPRFQHAIPQSPTNIHTDHVKALVDQPARLVNYKAVSDDASAVTISVVDKTDGYPTASVQTTRSQYKLVNTPIMKGDSLITRQIKTYGIPVDPLAMPDVAPAAPLRPKVVAPKGYQVTHSRSKVVKKKEAIVKKAPKRATDGEKAAGDQVQNNVTQSLPAEQNVKENEKATVRNYSDPSNMTRIPATVFEAEEVDVVIYT